MAAVVAQEEQPISRTYQYRKVMKPMLERKRRARINRCLDELKELLVGALQSQGESVTRLEKADVLELTVRHLHKLQRSQQLSENSAGERYRQGFVHCANEVSKYITNTITAPNGAAVDISVSTRLVAHLDQCVQQIQSTQLQHHHQQMIQQGSPPHPQQLVSQGSANNLSQVSPVSLAYSASAVAAGMISPVGSSPNGGGNNLNVLTTYTPPSSPISSPNNNSNGHHHHHPKIYYIPSSSVGGSSPSSSTGSLSPIPPAHYNQFNVYAAQVGANPQPLSLCTKTRNLDEPFDLSGTSVWRPW